MGEHFMSYLQERTGSKIPDFHNNPLILTSSSHSSTLYKFQPTLEKSPSGNPHLEFLPSTCHGCYFTSVSLVTHKGQGTAGVLQMSAEWLNSHWTTYFLGLAHCILHEECRDRNPWAPSCHSSPSCGSQSHLSSLHRNCPDLAPRNGWKAASRLWCSQIIKLDSLWGGQSYFTLSLTPKGYSNYSLCLLNKLSWIYSLYLLPSHPETCPLEGCWQRIEIHIFLKSWLLKGKWHYY